MTTLQYFGVALIALGVIYALLYVWWVHRARRRHAAEVAVEPGRTTRDETVETVTAEGTYLGTTELKEGRIAPVLSLGGKIAATLTVHRAATADLLRIERSGVEPLVVSADRLGSVRTVRSRGRNDRALAVNWDGPGGEVYQSTFLPRLRADLDRVESALWWHSGGTDVRTVPSPTDDTPPDVDPDPDPDPDPDVDVDVDADPDLPTEKSARP